MEILTLFLKLITRILGYNYVKDLRLTKTVRKLHLKGPENNKSKNNFSRDKHGQNICKNLWFSCKIALHDKISLFNSKECVAVLAKFCFWDED